MKIIKIICIVFVAAIVATVGGFVIYNEVTTVDFGEIAIENIPQKSEDTERVISFNLRCADDEEGSVKNRSKIALAIIAEIARISVSLTLFNCVKKTTLRTTNFALFYHEK